MSPPLAPSFETKALLASPLAEFQLLGRHFILLDSALSPSSHKPSTAKGFTPVGRIEIEGRTYTVMEVMHRANSSLSTLLTGRELEVATLVARGYVNKQIADMLQISEWTVCAHLRRIFAKLGVDSRAAMVYRCAALLPPG